jgi:hypothetical protein
MIKKLKRRNNEVVEPIATIDTKRYNERGAIWDQIYRPFKK